MNIESMAIELPRCDDHPNRVPFRGVLTLVDAPSDKPPSGARGHRVLLARAAAERALPSLLGMGLDYAPTLDRHDTRRKVGVITEANVVASRHSEGCHPERSRARGAAESRDHSELCHPERARDFARESRDLHFAPAAIEVAGYLYARDFPELVDEMRRGGRQLLGMSYEIADAHIAEMHAPIWRVTQFTFTGAALLRRDKAAYRDTWIELA